MEDSSASGTSTSNTNVFTYTEAEANQLLGDALTDVAFLNKPSTVDLRRKYEFETKRIISLELHLTTLIEYYRNQRIPRGMRSQSRPNMFFQDNDFRAKFEKISNKYAYDMILLNIEFLRMELARVRARLEEVERLLKTTLTTEDLTKYLQRHETILKKYKEDLEETKCRKWHRDIQDYTTGRVYNWTVTKVFNNFDRRNNVDSYVPNNSEPFLGVRTTKSTTGDPPDVEVDTDTENGRTRSQRNRNNKQAPTKKAQRGR